MLRTVRSQEAAHGQEAKNMSHSNALRDIYDAIEQRVFAIVSAQPVWPCEKGCDDCCRQLAQPPQVSAAEWTILQQGLAQLEATVQADVARRLQALADRASGPVVCPFLDEQAGACRVYHHRPAVCRMYGFYVSRDGNQWCDAIQASYDMGMGQGVVLGNAQAVQHELSERFGESRSVADWFEQTLSPSA